MLLKSLTRTTTIPASTIWNKYADVPNWNTWDKSVISSSIDGGFVEGAKGILMPTSGPKVEFEITTLTKYVYFNIRSQLPLAYIDFEHAITDDGEIRTITHSISIGGPLALIFKILIGPSLKGGLDALDNLILTEI
jgi:hypothetical protein